MVDDVDTARASGRVVGSVAAQVGPAVVAEGLTQRFGNFTAVDDISFEVGRGEIFGFLGPNGAGKSTTIKMLATRPPPTSGRAVLAGFDVARQRMQVRQSIGLVFQDHSLEDRLTAQRSPRPRQCSASPGSSASRSAACRQ